MINMELFHLNFLYSKLIFMLYVEISWSAGRLLPNKEKTPTQITSDKFQGVEELKNGEEMFDMAEEFMVERRIDLESNDYPGTGANNRHDPKTPGGP
ncbi:hypothetical protein D0Y65_005696 [Glycine soja]|uniref:Uncharacterized protein n=1 Tax=Glycine soja TaxID=3848 RepID=A0A445L5Q4_GLYSO|nr:hypothetical protein D0Y65_005696 [Glycine soja]